MSPLEVGSWRAEACDELAAACRGTRGPPEGLGALGAGAPWVLPAGPHLRPSNLPKGRADERWAAAARACVRARVGEGEGEGAGQRATASGPRLRALSLHQGSTLGRQRLRRGAPLRRAPGRLHRGAPIGRPRRPRTCGGRACADSPRRPLAVVLPACGARERSW